VQRAVSRKRGCMPADSFVRIWKFIARPNLCGTPRLREAATTLAASVGQRSTIGKRKTEKPRAESGGKILK